eukprot:COSAG03_NODE_201_length_10708_cov_1057.852162_7_plen_114_part_00
MPSDSSRPGEDNSAGERGEGGEKRDEVKRRYSQTAEMLELLAAMMQDEYVGAGRAHWGSEDRRTKLLFLALDRPLMYKIVGVLVAQVLSIGVSTGVKFLSNREKLQRDPDDWE